MTPSLKKGGKPPLARSAAGGETLVVTGAEEPGTSPRPVKRRNAVGVLLRTVLEAGLLEDPADAEILSAAEKMISSRCGEVFRLSDAAEVRMMCAAAAA